jgi:Xaa-Pro aminopeptidase
MLLSEKLVKSLSSSIDAALVTSVQNRLYFSSFESHCGYFLVMRDGTAYSLMDFRYYESALNQVKDSEVVLFRDIKITLKDLASKHKIKRIAVERNDLTLKELRKFEDLFKESDVIVTADGELDCAIAAMRCIKSEKEIEKIIASQKITEQSFEQVLSQIKPGITTELEIALDLEFDMRKNGASSVSFDFIVVSGKKTSMPHGKPGNKKIENNEFLTLDIGAVFDGYHSDMTRMVSVGKLSEEELKIYDIVLNAQLRGIESVRAGVAAKDVDKAVRNFIKDQGYSEYFGHSTGHGVGLDVHEDPRISETDETILESGMIITIEPGIYLPGKFGVRIEDMVVVTKDGCKNLTNITKKLITI